MTENCQGLFTGILELT